MAMSKNGEETSGETEVDPRAKRRVFIIQYKRRIVEQADSYAMPGEPTLCAMGICAGGEESTQEAATVMGRGSGVGGTQEAAWFDRKGALPPNVRSA